MVADAVAALVAIMLAVSIFGGDDLRLAAFLAAPIAVLVSKVIGLYDRDELVLRKSTLDESPQLFQLAALYALLLSLLQSQLVDGRSAPARCWGSGCCCSSSPSPAAWPRGAWSAS